MTKTNAGEIAALLIERRGYEQRGLTLRVAAVDAQLEFLGHRVEAPAHEVAAVEPSAERAVSPRGRKRKAV